MASSELELNKRVEELDVVERPLQSSRNNAGHSGNRVCHKACVATTADGMMYLIEKGVAPDGQEELKRIGGDQGSRIIRIGNKLPSDFRRVKSVEVKCQNATLIKLLQNISGFACSMASSESELNKRVLELEVVERPLQSSRNNAGSSGHLVPPYKACVATTTDGMMYLIEKGVAPDGQEELKRIGGDQGSRIIRIGNKLPSDFRHVKSVEVKCQNATLIKLLEASGVDYYWICINCWISTQEMQKIASQDLQRLWQMAFSELELNKRVVELDVVERHLQSSRSSSSPGSSGPLVPHEGCVATTADGMKYLIEKGVAPDDRQPELKRIGGAKGSRIVCEFPSDFRKTRSIQVKVQGITLNDLLLASGKDYNCLSSNCWNSTKEMETLATGEPGMSWQTKAGTVGIALMVALFALGKK